MAEIWHFCVHFFTYNKIGLVFFGEVKFYKESPAENCTTKMLYLWPVIPEENLYVFIKNSRSPFLTSATLNHTLFTPHQLLYRYHFSYTCWQSQSIRLLYKRLLLHPLSRYRERLRQVHVRRWLRFFLR